MIEFSITELVLGAWAILSTVFWWDSIQLRKQHMAITLRVFHDIAKGKVQVKETDDGFEFKEVKL